MSIRSAMAIADLPLDRSAIARSTRVLLATDPIARVRRLDPSRVAQGGLAVADDTLRALLDQVPTRRRRSRRQPLALGLGLLVGTVSVVLMATSWVRRSTAATARRDEAAALDGETPGSANEGTRVGDVKDPSLPAVPLPGSALGSGPTDVVAESPWLDIPAHGPAAGGTSVPIGMASRD